MPPKVTIHSISKAKISDESDVDRSLVNFSFDTPVNEFTVNVLGVSHSTGNVAEHGIKNISTIANRTVQELSNLTVSEIREYKANTEIQAEIDWTELYQEGSNQVNIYGKSLDGQWTAYLDE